MILLSLKVVKFDTKMYLNFSNFRGQTSAGGGQALVQKWGQVLDEGDPPVPPQEKNPACPFEMLHLIQTLSQFIWLQRYTIL